MPCCSSKASIGAGVNLANRKRRKSCDFTKTLYLCDELLKPWILIHNAVCCLHVAAHRRSNPFFQKLVKPVLRGLILFLFYGRTVASCQKVIDLPLRLVL